MKIKPNIRFTARKAGGLFVGVRYHFACHVVEDCETEKDEQHLLYRTLSFGLLVWTVEFEIITNYKP